MEYLNQTPENKIFVLELYINRIICQQVMSTIKKYLLIDNYRIIWCVITFFFT